MTKNNKKIVIDDRQMSLFELLSQERDERAVGPGSRCISARLMVAVKEAVKGAPKSRETIADEMSFETGAEITVHMINSWIAESHPHRFPGEYIGALCRVTGCTQPAVVIAEDAGLFALKAPDALRAEIQHYAEVKNKASAEERKRKALLAVIEGGGL